jgi:hypothetical protein
MRSCAGLWQASCLLFVSSISASLREAKAAPSVSLLAGYCVTMESALQEYSSGALSSALADARRNLLHHHADLLY